MVSQRHLTVGLASALALASVLVLAPAGMAADQVRSIPLPPPPPYTPITPAPPPLQPPSAPSPPVIYWPPPLDLNPLLPPNISSPDRDRSFFESRWGATPD